MAASRFLTCTRCSERIGAYEPLWWRHPDGAVDASSFLRVRDDPRRRQAGAAFFHAACLEAQPPPTSPLSSA
jgi:hypothetical protein